MDTETWIIFKSRGFHLQYCCSTLIHSFASTCVKVMRLSLIKFLYSVISTNHYQIRKVKNREVGKQTITVSGIWSVVYINGENNAALGYPSGMEPQSFPPRVHCNHNVGMGKWLLLRNTLYLTSLCWTTFCFSYMTGRILYYLFIFTTLQQISEVNPLLAVQFYIKHWNIHWNKQSAWKRIYSIGVRPLSRQGHSLSANTFSNEYLIIYTKLNSCNERRRELTPNGLELFLEIMWGKWF